MSERGVLANLVDSPAFEFDAGQQPVLLLQLRDNLIGAVFLLMKHRPFKLFEDVELEAGGFELIVQQQRVPGVLGRTEKRRVASEPILLDLHVHNHPPNKQS